MLIILSRFVLFCSNFVFLFIETLSSRWYVKTVMRLDQASFGLSVRPSTVSEIDNMEYFYEIVHAYTCQHCLTTAMHNNIFDGQGFAEHQL